MINLLNLNYFIILKYYVYIKYKFYYHSSVFKEKIYLSRIVNGTFLLWNCCFMSTIEINKLINMTKNNL